MTIADRQAVLIAGMHRSGTSAVAGAVNLLGAAAPVHMIPASTDNPLGFWESPIVIGVNDTILRAGKSTWYDCLGLDCSTFNERDRTTAKTFVMASILAAFADDQLLLIKDPRLCLLLDFWLPALREMRISPATLLVLRHPCQVLDSMAERDALPGELIAALWLRYMLAAEYGSRGCPRHILPYHMLLHDWRRALLQAGEAAAIAWRVSFESITPRMNALLKPELQHHHVINSAQQRAGSPLGRWADEVYQALLVLGANPADQIQLQRLDRLRGEFQQWCQDHGCAWSATVLAGHPIHAQHPGFEIPFSWEDAASGLQSNPPDNTAKP